MEAIPYTSELSSKWDMFCLADSRAWFWHTSMWMRYSQNSSFQIETINKSFLVMDDQEVLAIIPLFIEKKREEKDYGFTYGGAATPIYLIQQQLTSKKQKECQRLIEEMIVGIAYEYEIKHSYFGLSFIEQMQHTEFFYKCLLLRGFSDISSYTSLLDLDKNEDDISIHLSANHRRNIKKANEMITYHYYDCENITEENFNYFKYRYFQIAGKQTRPDETFDCLYEYIKKQNGFLFYARLDEKIIGYVYVITYKNSAYYAIGANEKEVSHIPVAHGLHWFIICFLKSKGFKFYEIGAQSYDSLLQVCSQKEKNISRFKREFGGSVVPRYSAEYFYSKEYFLKTINNRAEKYAELKWGE